MILNKVLFYIELKNTIEFPAYYWHEYNTRKVLHCRRRESIFYFLFSVLFLLRLS